MNRYLCLFLALVSIAAGAGCASAVNVEEERTALMAADRAWSETTKDPEKFAAYFADGGSIYPPGMPVVTGARGDSENIRGNDRSAWVFALVDADESRGRHER